MRREYLNYNLSHNLTFQPTFFEEFEAMFDTPITSIGQC